MFLWSEKRIEWYQRAVAYNRFDAALADAVEPFLPLGETVCDLGCGIGYLAAELARRGYDVTAVDASRLAMDHLRAEKERLGLERLTVEERDWYTLDGAYWDNVVMVFAGHFDEDMALFLSFARKRLILIIKDDDQSHIQPGGVTLKQHFTGDLIRTQLAGRAYTTFPLSAQLGQPLHSEEEARDYLAAYGADQSTSDVILRRMAMMQSPDAPLYLPAEKHMRVFIIENSELD